jgi:4-aminobutyrate aminotransferase-like enzyme
VHLGVDIFAPAGTPILAPLNGEIIAIENRKNTLDYGGMIILKHVADNHGVFYSLYGHLSPNFPEYYKIGLEIKKGQQFCFLGDDSVNGGWAPHLHFQIALTTNGLENDWPGVADPDDLDFFNSICPNPAAILNLPNEKVEFVPLQKNEILAQRKASFGSNLRLSYDEPAMFLRGWKTHLFDEWGRPYLDAYNNVPHVGHSHPRIRNAALEQLKKLNSNTRYLHPKQSDLAESILSKLPETFKVCYFVNSGSEANELALRLAREHTKAKGMITMDHGYFGNTTGAIDISAYKFNKPGGVGQPDWLELVEIPDDYRGTYKKEDPNRGEKFAGQINQAIAKLKSKNQNLCGFIAETFPSVGGQIITPPGYLAEVYRQIRDSGGVCIADEVQTGLGRLGNHYFGFEYQKVCPDIVVLGKPIGNGYPIGVVATTKEIANNFDNGIEFFSTFGGSTLSCVIANEVIEIVEDESLQSNARKMGEKLKTGLKNLQNKYNSIGDVRGMGLFVGIELIDENGKENTRLCTFVKNRMRDFRILIGSEGPMDNVIKIRPPLSIELEGINMIIDTLDVILKEETF